VQLADDWGIVVRIYDYDPYGNQLIDNDDCLNPYRYNGQYYDFESGYIYLRHRYYDTSLGRFISEDPIFDGWNWYVYANNNPIRYHDPSGLWYKGFWGDLGNAFVDTFKWYGESWINGFNSLDQMEENVKHLGNALSASSSLELSGGFGIGGKAKLFTIIDAEAQMVLWGQDISFSANGFESNEFAGLGLGAGIFERYKWGLGIGGDAVFSRPLPAEYPRQYGLIFDRAPNSSFEYYGALKITENINIPFFNSNREESTDFEISLGASAYFVFGGGIDYTFNVSEFKRRFWGS
jgi:RHS repeat-associated protein